MPGTQDLDKVERYRLAAEEALNQLDWAIGYLYRIRKTPEADVLADNRQAIRQGLQRGARRD